MRRHSRIQPLWILWILQKHTKTVMGFQLPRGNPRPHMTSSRYYPHILHSFERRLPSDLQHVLCCPDKIYSLITCKTACSSRLLYAILDALHAAL